MTIPIDYKHSNDYTINDYTIGYIHSQMTIQIDYTIDYIHSQMPIQLLTIQFTICTS